jgi:signal transduction histidine kinase
VQEGLTNAARHGAATNVWISVAGGAAITVMVEDDGTGISAVGAGNGGMGLKGTRERLAALGGRLALGARSGGGTRLVAVIPRVHAMEPVA